MTITRPARSVAESPLTLDEAVSLAYTLVQFVADTAGIRILFLKGFVVSAQGLRPHRTPADVDVLVEPGRLESLLAALGDYGWSPRHESAAPRFFALHSHDLTHPDWPCDVDLHGYYPGFYAEPVVVFEELWTDRATLTLCGWSLDVPSRPASACILAAHALRNENELRSAVELAYVTRVIRDSDPSEVTEVAGLTRRLRAQETLRPWLLALGISSPARDLTDEERWSWNLRVGSAGTSSYHWWVSLLGARWYLKPVIGAQILGLGMHRAASIVARNFHRRGEGATGSGSDHGVSALVVEKVREFHEVRQKMRARHIDSPSIHAPQERTAPQ